MVGGRPGNGQRKRAREAQNADAAEVACIPLAPGIGDGLVIAIGGRPWLFEPAMKTIVVAVDFSNATAGVLEMACSIAKAFDGRLCLFHVVEPEPSYTAYGFTPDEFPALHAYQEEAKRRANQKLDELLAKVKATLPSASSRIAEGSPLHALLDFVKESRADLVVLGSHGHGAIASLLLGSVAEGMVRKAAVPTLIVPAGPEA
jgi:nucleotide-binding universal stress UspA family protein